MSKRDLILVESVVKARKIQSYLRGRYLVLATIGHLLNLPQKGMGVAVGASGANKGRLVLDWERAKKTPMRPRPGQKPPEETVSYLRRNARQCGGRVIIATDDDREGETIGAHAVKLLGLPEDTPRIRFNVLTREAIEEALDNPGRINPNRVEAQEARRALDRVIGYTMSPKLSRRLYNALTGSKKERWVSTGRVQAPTLKAIAGQSKKHNGFTPSSRYAPGHLINGVFFALPVEPCATREEALAIAAEKPPGAVASRTELDRNVRPRPAAATIDVLQAFSRTTAPDVPMRIMQDLHEAGVITYHRTDARSLDAKWVRRIRAGLGADAGVKDPPGGRKVAHQQGAHEAIRPAKTIVGVPREVLDMPRGHQNVYRFIANRAVGACMRPGVDTAAQITLDNGAAAALVREKTPGWRKLSPSDSPQAPPEAAWAMKQGDALAEAKAAGQEIQAPQPPAPTSPWVLGWMEKNGVGRPSTFASTLNTMKEHGLVKITPVKTRGRSKESVYALTSRGSLVLQAINDLAPALLRPQFTERMEASLDRIATGAARNGEAVQMVEEGAALAGRKVDRVATAPEPAAQMQ